MSLRALRARSNLQAATGLLRCPQAPQRNGVGGSQHPHLPIGAGVALTADFQPPCLPALCGVQRGTRVTRREHPGEMRLSYP